MSLALVLASTSKYRRELLSKLGLSFAALSPLLDEETKKKSLLAQNPELAASDLALGLAQAKAESLLDSHGDSWILGSDQLVHLDTKVLGKTATRELSHEQLALMSGKTHELITAFCLVKNNEKPRLGLNIARIEMRKLSHAEIDNYISLDQPFDCAGTYKFESAGLSLVQKMECSDPSALIGLPLIALTQELRRLGFKI